MRKQFPTLGRLAVLGLVCALSVTVWAQPARAYHKERKTVTKVVATYKEIQEHSKEGKLDWHHLDEELKGIAKPIRALGHHDNVDLFKPLEDSVHRQDQAGLEKAFMKIFFYLMRENLHRTEDSAGDLEKNLIGFIENARMAYGPMAGEHGSADKEVERIFKEMEATAREGRALKAKLEAQKKELEARLGKAHGH